MSNLLKIIIIIFFIIAVAALSLFFLAKAQKKTLLSPKPDITAASSVPDDNSLSPKVLSSSNSLLPDKSGKPVIGFLPFWLLDKADSIPLNNITHLAYFSLTVSPDGDFVTILEDGTSEPGAIREKSETFQNLKTKAHEKNIKVLLTITMMDNESIEKFLTSPKAQDNLIGNTLEILRKENFDGLNIDFEYMAAPSEKLTKNFTKFVKTITQKNHEENHNYSVSVSVLSDSVIKTRLTEIWPLSQVTDYLVIMGYDFFRPSSETAGPISPLSGRGKYYEYDLTQTLNDFLKSAPPEKLILGLPFYGYDWIVDKPEPFSKTLDTGALSSFGRTMSLIKDRRLKEQWDNNSQTPFVSYLDDDGSDHLIFYDNQKSLRLKLDLVKEKNLAGIAIWALGYEGNNPDLWSVINDAEK